MVRNLMICVRFGVLFFALPLSPVIIVCPRSYAHMIMLVLLHISMLGILKTVLGLPRDSAGLQELSSISVDPSGYVYVADLQMRRYVRVNPTSESCFSVRFVLLRVNFSFLICACSENPSTDC